MKSIRIVIALTLMLALVLAGQAHAAAKQIAIVPFKVNADKDVSFLRDGIYDMLSSRLYKEGEVEVIGRPQVEKTIASVAGGFTEARARDIGKLMGADFLLFGSLTVLGNSISVDSKMVDVSGARPTLSFFEQSADAGGIVTRVNQMAADINDKMFGRTPAARAAAPAAAAQGSAAPAPPGREAFDPFAHPEKMLKQGTTGEGRSSPFVSEDGGSREVSPQFWKGPSYKHAFNGVALGDVDGDGQIETVLITPNRLLILRNSQGRLQTVYESEEARWDIFIGVDVADINGNGRPEIFVTSLALGRESLKSFVLEFDGKSYSRVAEDMRFFLRVVDTPARGAVLLGQAQRTGEPYSGEISEMIWRNGRYEPEDRINASGNVLGFALGDIVGDGSESIAAFTNRDRIRVIGAGGQILWTSSEMYGGSTIYYENRSHYLPMRLLTMKSPKDGKTTVLAVKNHDMAGMHLKVFRSFSDAQLMLFAWDGLGLSPQWRTRKLSGMIRDFAVGDFNNDGRKELLCAVVIEEGVIVGTTPKSTLIALEFAE